MKDRNFSDSRIREIRESEKFHQNPSQLELSCPQDPDGKKRRREALFQPALSWLAFAGSGLFGRSWGFEKV